MKILNRWTDAIVWEGAAGTVAEAVYAALKSGANLRGANLRGANLGDADLRDADLGDADLGDADLGDADLGDADLRRADLRRADLGGANLGGANLRGANLCDADLGGADLGDADLGGANLGGANLRGANLCGADLAPIRDDLWAVLSASPAEVPGLLTAIREGRIDGSTYEGDCACLVGTLEHVAGAPHNTLPLLKANSSRPAEMFFLSINRGDTPATNQFAQLAAAWIEDWLTRMRATFGAAA
jgi:hypothetical protein